ncbi:MAG: assimilatory sulfite reductase (NADPH) flavoprotein subunit [Luteimonas sp.]|nr:assimilatory sulfite reductase (NADPH) flavoprotein subunit [Luteimonas sp.]
MSLPQALLAPPLSAEMADAVARLTQELDNSGLWWLSGYAAGLASRSGLALPLPTESASAQPTSAVAARQDTAGRLTIVYGSQTGNARRVAEQLAAEVEGLGLPVRLLRADAYATRELKHERHLYLVISTQGDGDPPDDARELVDFITGKRAPRLEQLHYAILGLGDSSYPQFCAIGQTLDARLAELGAQRLLPRGDADLDIDTVASPWRRQALAVAKEALKPLATVTPLRPQAVAVPSSPAREQPFAAELLVNQRITSARSGKDVRHIELSLEGSGLQYAPGDALGVWPRNPDALVEAVLDTLRLDGDSVVAHAEQTLPLRGWLTQKRELTKLARPFLLAHGERSGDAELQALLAPGNAALGAWLGERQVIDLLQAWPADWAPEALVAALRPLVPRLYSIASSQKVVGDEAHLTVAHVEYERAGATRWGAASHFLASRADGDALPIHIERNERFRLPADASRDVIMIGPGTGVAPFRGFVQERAAIGAAGRNWLFFGNPHFSSHFLYQLEWQRALKSGQLQRLDLAFSRDRMDRIYVQQRLREQGRDVYDWLHNGAHLYVCGAIAMGKGVHTALLEVIATHNGGDADAAASFLQGLQSQGRYARDVY